MKYEIKKTDVFDQWLSKLKDRQALLAINMRIIRAINGNFGDSKVIASNLLEMRVFVGKGYRVYYSVRNNDIILLINGGHKGTQSKDIEKAKILLSEWEQPS